MTFRTRNAMLTLALAACLVPAGLRALAPTAPSNHSYSGVVGDDMCGVKHDMGGSDADCTRMCVDEGANYDLVIGQKAYTLATQDKQTLATLRKLAGKRAVVNGTLAGTTITVRTVAAK